MLSIAPEAKTIELPLDRDVRTPAPRSVAAGRRQLNTVDAHRLTLQAKLTGIGVPLHPGDRGALRQLAALDTESVDAVVRWLSCAAGSPWYADGTPRAGGTLVDDGTLLDDGTHLDGPLHTDAPPHPDDLVDPRLIAW